MNRHNPNRSIFRHTGGFTFIEWMVASSLFAVLFAMTASFFESVRENARAAQCRENMRLIAFAVLDYESEHRVLPGPIFRRVSAPVGEPDATELNWFINEFFELNSQVWSCPSNETAMNFAESPVFILNNQLATMPPRFFGYPSGVGNDPMSIGEIVAARRTPPGSFATNLRQIWMISDVDSNNYSMPGEEPQPPPHSGGRHYVFFDGSLEHRTLDDLPF